MITMKKQKIFLIIFVLFFSLLAGISFSLNSSSAVGTEVESGSSLLNYFSGHSSSISVQSTCSGISCPLPNSVNVTTA